jgi:Ca2+-binding RTX toxin-like protein
MTGAASDVTMTLGAGTQTANFGAGDDTITMASGAKTVDTGAGADTVSTTVALVGSTDTISGGDGTDTLKLTTIDTIAAASFANVTGFERLSMNQANLGGDKTIDLDNFNTTFSRISIGDTDDNTVTIDNAGSSFTDLRYTKDFQATPAAVTDSEITLNRKTDTSTDAVTLTIAGGNTLKALDLADEETITFATSGTGTATITAATVTDAKTMIFTGSNTIAFANTTAGLAGEGQLATIDASALTGALTVNASASIVNMTVTGNADAGGVITLTTGAGADTITGGFAGDTINGGIGNDTINGGAGGDTIDGDEGNDTITGGGGADTITTGEGNDTINGFTIGASGDKIKLDLSGIEAIKADGTNVINLIEGDLDVGNVAASDNIVASVLTGAKDLDSVADGNNLLVLDGTVSESGLLTALSVGGSFQLTLGGALQNDEAILVLHTDGTNAYLKTITNISGITITDGDTLTVAELSADLVTTFAGISDVGDWHGDNDTTVIA